MPSPESGRSPRPRPDFVPPDTFDAEGAPHVDLPAASSQDEAADAAPPPPKRGLFGGKKSSRSGKGDATARTAKKGASGAKGSRVAGGRWRLLLMRVAVWAVICVVGIAGVRAILFPPAPDVNAIATAIGKAYGLTSFPSATGEALAVQFARVYLNVNPDYADSRAALLRTFLSLEPGDTGWVEGLAKQAGRQVVCAGPYLAQPATVSRDEAGWRVSYLVGAQVAAQPDPKVNPCAGGTGGTQVYLSVPMFAALPTSAAQGLQLAVSGPPGIMPGPPRGAETGLRTYPLADQAIVDSIATDLTNYFTAWAKSDPVGLNTYLSPEAKKDPTGPASAGLNGTAKLAAPLEKVRPAQAASLTSPRLVEADVTWTSEGNTWTQTYTLYVVKPTGSNTWQVMTLNGGTFDTPANRQVAGLP